MSLAIGPRNAFSQQLHAETKIRIRYKGDVRLQRFSEQKSNANRRGIPWKLTFKQWWMIWKNSGKWKSRGRLKGQYCLSRIADKGNYEVGNVFVQLREHNDRERVKNGTHGGARKGNLPPNTKLTYDDVATIKVYLDCGIKGRKIAKLFNVTEQTVSAIKHEQNWKYVKQV